MLKKLYVRLSKGYTRVFDITRTVRVDEPDFTKWIISVDPHNELHVEEVEADTDDYTIDIIEGEALVIAKLLPAEWTIHIESEGNEIWTLEGEIYWEEGGGLKIHETYGIVLHLPENSCDFEVDMKNRVVIARLKD